MMDDIVSRRWLLREYGRKHKGKRGKAFKMISDAPSAGEQVIRKIYHPDTAYCEDGLISRRELLEALRYSRSICDTYIEEYERLGARTDRDRVKVEKNRLDIDIAIVLGMRTKG